MCGGFTCSKNALTALNILYVVVGFILIVAAVYGRASALVTNLPIIGGILACGIFLILVSILGLFGAIQHNQYMVILFLLLLVQFSVACACLAVDMQEQERLAEEGWRRVNMELKAEVQKTFSCCGFDGKVHPTDMYPNSTDPMAHPQCLPDPACCKGGSSPNCICPPCMAKLQDTINYAFKLCGGIGLFFSFSEVIGILVAFRYRNQVNPNLEFRNAIYPNTRDYR